MLRFNLVKLRFMNLDPSTSQVTKSKSTTLVDFNEAMVYHYGLMVIEGQSYTKDKRALIEAQRTCDAED